MPLSSGTAAVLRGDAARLALPDGSVDLIVTSPPYWSQRSYRDGGEHYAGQIGAEPTPREFIDNLIRCTAEWVRVLKPSGSMWVNLGDKYATRYASTRGAGRAGLNGDDGTRGRTGQNRTGVPEKSLIGLPWRYAIRCVDDLGLILRAEIIWSKPNGLPESVTDRVRRSHEIWFHLVKQPRYFTGLDAIREALTSASPEHDARRRKRRDARMELTHSGRTSTANPLGKLPGSVWEIATQPLIVPEHVAHARCCGGGVARPGCRDGLAHHAAFPMAWPRRIIQGWSPQAAVVLDPFGGTGTTALVAKAVGRRGITVDMSADYCRLARWRTTDPGQLARAAGLKPGKRRTATAVGAALFDHPDLKAA